MDAPFVSAETEEADREISKGLMSVNIYSEKPVKEAYAMTTGLGLTISF